MKLIAVGKQIILQNAPDAVGPFVRQWFAPRGTKAAEAMPIEPRRVLALTQHYRDRLTISPEVNAWLKRGLDVKDRIARRLKTYRGGYQADIVARMVADNSHGCWIDAGGGKTPMALEIARLLGPTLLIVPPVIWRQAYVGNSDEPGELAHYRDLEIADATRGNAEERRRALRSRADLYVVSPYVLGGLEDELDELPLAAQVWDESSVMRNARTRMAEVALQTLAAKTKFKFPLSANPCPSDVGELWTQVEWMRPNTFGSWREFGTTYGDSTRWGYEFRDMELAVRALEQVRPFSTMIPQAAFWGDAPKLHVRTVAVELGPRERAAYESLDANLQLRVGKDEFGGDELVAVERALGKRMRLREITSGFVYVRRRPRWVGERSKLRAIRGLIARAPREQYVIWGQFEAEMELIAAALNADGYAAGYYRGDRRESRQFLDDFRAGRLQVIIANTASLGHGVRLERACRAIYASLPDSPDEFYQSQLRIYRPPQVRDCEIFLVVARNTVDEDQLAALRRRMAWRSRLERVLYNHYGLAA